MSQINPYRGIIVPSPRPQDARPQKDRQGQKREQAAKEEEEKKEGEVEGEEGEKRLDLKA